jgi:hypothetical protein
LQQPTHAHSWHDVAPLAFWKLPAGQDVHALEPVVDLKEPGAHAPHVPEPEKDAEYPQLWHEVQMPMTVFLPQDLL